MSSPSARDHQARRLEETMRGLDAVQRSAGVGSWTYDLRTHAVTWSDEQYRLFRLEPGEVEPSLGAFLAMVHRDDRTMVEETVAATIEAKTSFSYTYRIVRDGQTRILLAAGQVTCDADATAVLLSGTTQDLTEQKMGEAALQLSTERFELAARATHDALWDWDIATGDLWWSDAFSQQFGYTDAFPRTLAFWSSLIHPDDRTEVDDSLNAFLASTDESWMLEYRFRRADHTYVWVLDRGFVVRDRSGAAVRMLGSMMNVTAQKDADRLKSDFVAFASHQLRTPLTGISWMLELARGVPDLPEAALAHILDAEASAHRLVRLVNDLLDVSRLETAPLTMSLETMTLEPMTQAIVDELRQSFADQRHLLVLNLGGATRPVRADPQLLRQVIMNLVSNALQYTPPRGRIAISVTDEPGAVRWSIADSGIGISRSAQEHLFHKFFRADNAVAMVTEGTGLGLHLVRLIIQQSGGTIWCESEGDGRGATFTFELPATEGA